MLRVVCPECERAQRPVDIAGEFGCGCQLGRRIYSFCRGTGDVTFAAYEHWRRAQAGEAMDRMPDADAIGPVASSQD